MATQQRKCWRLHGVIACPEEITGPSLPFSVNPANAYLVNGQEALDLGQGK
jgi:hypothetical protein